MYLISFRKIKDICKNFNIIYNEDEYCDSSKNEDGICQAKYCPHLKGLKKERVKK